jgi:hypothetical protein
LNKKIGLVKIRGGTSGGIDEVGTVLDTTVGFLLGEAKKQDVLKDQAMLKRLNNIASFPEEDKQHILLYA